MGYSHIFLCFITTSYQSDAGQYNNILGSNSNMLHQKNKFIPSQLTHYQVPLDPQTSSPETTFTKQSPRSVVARLNIFVNIEVIETEKISIAK